jgi:hypothetical protein
MSIVALAILKEKFPEPWLVHVGHFGQGACTVTAERGPVRVELAVRADEKVEDAARRLVSAWDEATRDECAAAVRRTLDAALNSGDGIYRP